jgi:Tfp pilus assembly protein PilF
LRSSPENLEVHNNLGNALTEVGQVDAAIVEYEFVLKRNPDHANAHNNYGIALVMKGRLDEAMRHFHEALRLKPDDASAHGNLGNAFAVQHNFIKATKHYREALHLAPSDAQTRNNLGNVLAEQGQFHEAVANYRAAFEAAPIIQRRISISDAHSRGSNRRRMPGGISRKRSGSNPITPKLGSSWSDLICPQTHDFPEKIPPKNCCHPRSACYYYWPRKRDDHN